MRKILAVLIFVLLAFNVSAQDFKPTNEDYDISESMIKASVTRTNFYTKDSFFATSINSEEFLNVADKSKPTVIYLHGCNYDYPPYERSLLKFYLCLRFHFLLPLQKMHPPLWLV